MSGQPGTARADHPRHRSAGIGGAATPGRIPPRRATSHRPRRPRCPASAQTRPNRAAIAAQPAYGHRGAQDPRRSSPRTRTSARHGTAASRPASQLPRQHQHRPTEDPGRQRLRRPHCHRRRSRHHLPGPGCATGLTSGGSSWRRAGSSSRSERPANLAPRLVRGSGLRPPTPRVATAKR
jgi:hypothetical protein